MNNRSDRQLQQEIKIKNTVTLIFASCPLTALLPSQCVDLYLPGPRVSRPDPQDGHDQRRWSHCAGAQPVLHLQPAHLCASLPLAAAGLELSQVPHNATVTILPAKAVPRTNMLYNRWSNVILTDCYIFVIELNVLRSAPPTGPALPGRVPKRSSC